MSSSRRRGRSSGSPATGRPAAALDDAPEAVTAEAPHETAPIEAAEVVGEPTDTAAIPEIPAETSPETMQAAVGESLTKTAEQAADTAETLQDATAATAEDATEAAAEQTAEAVEQATEHVTETVEAVQEPVATHAAETVDRVAETATTLAAAPLAVAEAVVEATDAQIGAPKSFTGTAGARFTFVPTFEPLNEINATLLAFARGEGEAAMAHLQALTKAKSPAEAIRLQVSEFQRAADASLTCFSHILRSANRLGGPARWN